ncbi:MAG: thiamine-phosphate kinase [Bacteroidales bacterium]
MFEDRDKHKTDLSTLGEFGLIDHLTREAKTRHASTITGVGDDTAVIDAGDKYMLVTKDLLLEGIHFDVSYTPMKHLGYKAVVVNLSDIYAMNGTPKQIAVGLGISSRYTLEALEELYEGMYLACEKYNVDMVGGDTTSSVQGLVISITAIGEVEKDRVVYRGPALENDLLCVSGDLGAAYAGLLILEREKTVFKADPNMQPDLEGHTYILERQLKPEARQDVIARLREIGVKPTAMIDISDGLASEIKHICKHSDLGCEVYEKQIPIDQHTYDTALSFKMDPTTYAMNGGEDYELLFTIRPEDHDKIKEMAEISVIGHMTDKNAGINLITSSGPVVEIKAQGWDHLKREE